jgi:hypothetical protein
MDDPEPEWHRQAAAVNLVSLSDGVTPGRQGNGVEGWDNNNHIIYKINMYKYIYICVCAYRFFKNMQSNTKTTHHQCKWFFWGICCFSFCQLQMLHVAS